MSYHLIEVYQQTYIQLHTNKLSLLLFPCMNHLLFTLSLSHIAKPGETNHLLTVQIPRLPIGVDYLNARGAFWHSIH